MNSIFFLVLANPPPSNGKILYDASGPGYIITENFNARWVIYGYYTTGGPDRNHLRFRTYSKNPGEKKEFVDIKRDLLNHPNLTFAIDLFPYTRNYEAWCSSDSSKSLTKFIHECKGNALLRDKLTEKEKDQIQRLKDEHESK